MVVPRILTIAATGTVVLAVLAGCDLLAEQRLDFSDTEQVRITRITVAPGAGDVVIRTGGVSSVKIDRVVRYHGAEPDTSYHIDGTELVVDTDCGRRCQVSYDILAPEGVTVRGRNGSGDVEFTGVAGVEFTVGSGSIEVTDVSGAVQAVTGSGDITVSGASAAVTMRTGSGSINGQGLGGGQVDAKTGSGDVALILDKAGSVRAETSSGRVDVVVPPGDYQVRASAGSGEIDVRIPDDPTATLVIDVRTGSGDITLDSSR